MRFTQNLFFVIFQGSMYLFVTFQSCWANINTTVRLFPVGQGNAVLVRHGNEAIMLDAGSCASTRVAKRHKELRSIREHLAHSAADEAFAQHTFTCYARDQTEKHSGGSGYTSGDSYATSDVSIGDQPSNTSPPRKKQKKTTKASAQPASQDVSLKTQQKKLRVQHQEGIQEDLFKALPEKNNKRYLKTLLITHPDKDHYNMVSTLLPPERIHIDNIILSGCAWQYKKILHEWLQKVLQEAEKAGRKIICKNQSAEEEAFREQSTDVQAENTQSAEDMATEANTDAHPTPMDTDVEEHTSETLPTSNTPLVYCFTASKRADGSKINQMSLRLKICSIILLLARDYILSHKT